MIPSGALGDSATRVLLAVVDQSHPTVRSVAAEVGLSVTRTYEHLKRLRGEGLVDWTDGGQGTLHATARESHEHLYGDARMGSENDSGPRTADTAGDLPNAPRRR